MKTNETNERYPENNSPDNNLFPRYLTPEEIDNPQLVLEKFYDMTRLPQARECLWEILRAIVTGEYVKMNIRERSNMLFVYEQLQRLVEATYIIHMAYRMGKTGGQQSALN